MEARMLVEHLKMLAGHICSLEVWGRYGLDYVNLRLPVADVFLLPRHRHRPDQKNGRAGAGLGWTEDEIVLSSGERIRCRDYGRWHPEGITLLAGNAVCATVSQDAKGKAIICLQGARRTAVILRVQEPL